MWSEQTEFSESETKRLQAELNNKRAALRTIENQPEDHTWERLWPVIYGVMIIGFILYVYGLSTIELSCGIIGAVLFGLGANKQLAATQRRHEATKILEQSKLINQEIELLELNLLEQKYEKGVQNRKDEDVRKREELILEFDKDGNGIIDAVETEETFTLLLQKNQSKVLEKEKEFNREYLHQFVKIGRYLSDKRKNLQTLFELLKGDAQLEKLQTTLQQEVYSYNLLTLNSLDMLVSLTENDRITFYNLYERLDELGIFTSKYEREMLTKLDGISSGIDSLIGEIGDMNSKVVGTLEDLSYRTEESTTLLSGHLESIDSTMRVGNTLSAINLYQNYKTNKRLKG